MSQQQPDKEFWDLADRFITLANEHLAEVAPGKVSASLMYAAARFNAFVIASATEGDLADERDSAIRYLAGEYRKMLEENIDDYIRNPV